MMFPRRLLKIFFFLQQNWTVSSVKQLLMLHIRIRMRGPLRWISSLMHHFSDHFCKTWPFENAPKNSVPFNWNRKLFFFKCLIMINDDDIKLDAKLPTKGLDLYFYEVCTLPPLLPVLKHSVVMTLFFLPNLIPHHKQSISLRQNDGIFRDSAVFWTIKKRG